jgi:glycosyltransferase involved in cell wall biosynthesis
MPRARAEPMMCGVVTVNARNHDVDLFIKNGVNGFYSNDPDELREQLLYLMRNPEATRRMGGEARKTALDVFNHDRYLSQWGTLLKSLA